MFGIPFSAAPYPYLYCAWDFFKPGPASLSSWAISKLLSPLSKTPWGATAVSTEFIRNKLGLAEYFGQKDLKKASKLQNQSLLAPYEYARTALTIAARKTYFYINGQAISQTLCKRTAEDLKKVAQRKKLSGDQTRLATFEERVEKMFTERSIELETPTLSKSQLTAFSAQLAVENALPWMMRSYVVFSIAKTVTFDIPYIPTLLTVGFLWVYTNRLIPGIRSELVNLKAPKQSKPIPLIDDDITADIEDAAIQIFKLDKNVKDDKQKLANFKEAIEDLKGKAETNNPFLPLKNTAPSNKKGEGAKTIGAIRSLFSSVLSYVWSTDKKAEIEKKKAQLKVKYHALKAKENAAPTGTPEKFRAREQVQAVRRQNAELSVGEEDNAPGVVSDAYIAQIEAGHKATKLEGGDVKAYLNVKLEEVQTRITTAAGEEKFDLCEKLKVVKKHVESMKSKADRAVDLAKSTPVKSRKTTPLPSPRRTKDDTPRTTVKKAVDSAAGALSPDDKVPKMGDLDSADDSSGSETGSAPEKASGSSGSEEASGSETS